MVFPRARRLPGTPRTKMNRSGREVRSKRLWPLFGNATNSRTADRISAIVRSAKSILSALSEEWSEVQPGELVRQRAERLLAIHPLRSADAFQLAAALIWAQENPQGLEMVCFDQNLREAGHKEGFTLLP